MKLQKALEVFKYSDVDLINLAQLKKDYKTLAKEKHPDTKNGSSDEFVELRKAYVSLSSYLEKIGPNSNTLKDLSKDEILDKYYEDTQEMNIRLENMQDLIQEQNNALVAVRSGVDKIVNGFESKKSLLRRQLEEEIKNLEKKLSPNVLQKIFFFFWPKMTEEDFWQEYNSKIKKYESLDAEIDVEFLKEMLETYGDGLNNISKSISKAD